jgi:hypothetical protein
MGSDDRSADGAADRELQGDGGWQPEAEAPACFSSGECRHSGRAGKARELCCVVRNFSRSALQAVSTETGGSGINSAALQMLVGTVN